MIEQKLGQATTAAICDWLKTLGTCHPALPLFISLDFCNHGHRLTGDGLRKIVSHLCKSAGIKKPMSPHRIRHSAITAALDATEGNVRKVQKLSRHARIETLLVYDDNRAKDQREVSQTLDDLV